MDGKGLKVEGAPPLKELKETLAFPTIGDYERGPIAVIECIEEIPCNPCETSCPRGAISVGKPITNRPSIDFEKCSGCGNCVAVCPGLAIYIKDFQYNENECLIAFPFEYLPLPAIGDAVTMVDRMGRELCPGKIVKVQNPKEYDKTAIVHAVYSRRYFEPVVSMKRLK